MTARPFWRILVDPVAVLLCLAALALLWNRPPVPKPAPVVVLSAHEPEPEAPAPVIAPAPEPAPEAPKLDEAAVAKATAARDSARSEQQRAEARAAAASKRLESAELEAANAALAADTLAERVRDPSARLASVRQRGAALKDEQKKLVTELASLAKAPRPRRKPLIDKSPVARAAEGPEVHFEVRRDRVAFIDLDRLIDKVKADAMLQLRLSGGQINRPITSSVGPVGDFAMRYELARDMPGSLEEAITGRGSVSLSLRGWELVPIRDLRGETFEAMQQPASQFARALNSMNPQRSTITLWIYPDGFQIYRRLRGLLHARGFLVAARPLPHGMSIRGSPSGSLSAGQ